MATRSTIAIQHPNGTVSQIYAHWDGYPEWNGRLLNIFYSDYFKAKELLSHGNLSKLASIVNPTAKDHSFDNPQPNVCVYYGRDRGETDQAADHFADLNTFIQESDFEEYNYILVNGVWYVNDVDDADRVFHVLTEMLDEMVDDDSQLAIEYRNHRATLEVEVLPAPVEFKTLLLDGPSQ